MLIALHKPFNVLSQFTAEIPGQRTLAEFDLPKGVYAVGRLDRDSEGLLLLSDEPRLVKRLSDPASDTAKHYAVQVEGSPSAQQLQQLRSGVSIRIDKRGYRTAPAAVDILPDPRFAERQPPIRFRKTVPDAWLELVITEGKNRQVRRMCAAVGLPVLRLVRTQIGEHRLGELPPGEWRVAQEAPIR